jgi:hypothetical protein
MLHCVISVQMRKLPLIIIIRRRLRFVHANRRAVDGRSPQNKRYLLDAPPPEVGAHKHRAIA